MQRCWILLGILWCHQVMASYDVCTLHQCVDVVDVGSTGSRLHTYVYDLDQNNQPVNIFEHYVHRVSPGLATLTLDQDIINSYMDDLFAGSSEISIPVYVYATAGMRLRSGDEQAGYYKALRSWFAAHPGLELKDARTISGTLEGVFAWLAVNETLGTLRAENPSYAGVMDVGGASTQVVFALKNLQDIPRKDVVEFDLYGKHIALFSHSFLGLGIREVSHRFQNQAVCFPTGYPLPEFGMGQGNADTCQETVSNELNATYDVQKIVQPVLLVNPSDSWVVLGAVSGMLQTFPFLNNEFSLRELLESSNNLRCNPIWTDLQGQYPEDKDLYSSCLLGAYYYALTVNGYGFNPKQKIHYSSSIQQPDWTLGTVLRLA